MNKVFADIFSKQPDEIIDGDYFYYNPWHNEAQDIAFAARKGIKVEELENQRKKSWFGLDFAKGSDSSYISGSFKNFWDEKTFQNECWESSIEPNVVDEWIVSIQTEIENGFSKANEILHNISIDNKPFIDISSGDSWGLIPFIVKLNPKIPCMATDIYAHLIKCQRIFINSNLTQYNINLACFDNNNIPIKNNVFDLVTSTFGISSNASKSSQYLKNSIYTNKEKPINEVYRILKPGGCFLTIEKDQEWKFDLIKTRDAYNRLGKLFGKYTYDDIKLFYNKLQNRSWHDLFFAAGFQIEIEEKYPIESKHKFDIKYALSHLAHVFGIQKCINNENEKYNNLNLPASMDDFDKEAEEFGIEFTQSDNFYHLRKLV